VTLLGLWVQVKQAKAGAALGHADCPSIETPRLQVSLGCELAKLRRSTATLNLHSFTGQCQLINLRGAVLLDRRDYCKCASLRASFTKRPEVMLRRVGLWLGT
jgi:hypothetical protein